MVLPPGPLVFSMKDSWNKARRENELLPSVPPVSMNCSVVLLITRSNKWGATPVTGLFLLSVP
eukprot:11358329-Heterocapsa_arctica.AAC.1